MTPRQTDQPERPRAVLTALVERVGRGDEQALAELYDATSPCAYGLAVRVLGDTAQAEDVVAAAYLEVGRDAGGFDPTRTSGASWLLGVVHRLAVARLRLEGRLAERAHAGAGQPDARAAAGEDRAAVVRRALEALAPQQREALGLAYFGGLTAPEVAARLSIPVATAAARIRAALLRLRELVPEARPA